MEQGSKFSKFYEQNDKIEKSKLSKTNSLKAILWVLFILLDGASLSFNQGDISKFFSPRLLQSRSSYSGGCLFVSLEFEFEDMN